MTRCSMAACMDIYTVGWDVGSVVGTGLKACRVMKKVKLDERRHTGYNNSDVLLLRFDSSCCEIPLGSKIWRDPMRIFVQMYQLRLLDGSILYSRWYCTFTILNNHLGIQPKHQKRHVPYSLPILQFSNPIRLEFIKSDPAAYTPDTNTLGNTSPSPFHHH